LVINIELRYVGVEGEKERTFKGIVKEEEVRARTGVVWFRNSVTGGLAVDKAKKFRVP
jgi:hypothetical protein